MYLNAEWGGCSKTLLARRAHLHRWSAGRAVRTSVVSMSRCSSLEMVGVVKAVCGLAHSFITPKPGLGW